MGMMKKQANDPQPVTGPIREAIKYMTANSLFAIEREAGVSMHAIQRFVNGEGIRSDSIDRLAAYFKMTLKTET